MNSTKKPNVVVIGGGTGTFVVLSGLKSYPVNLTAVVSMMDSGGSTGRLRDQLGVLPPGDIRQALVALSESEEIWRRLFTYRFENGDLSGHNFGNIFISALEKITGSTERAVYYAAVLLKSVGKVLPVTLENASLSAKYTDGTLLESEELIDICIESRSRILYMSTNPTVKANPAVIDSLEHADFIIFGPGDLYTSLIPNLLVDGVNKALIQSNACKILVLNLMTKLGQTENYQASDFVTEIGKYLGKDIINYVLACNTKPEPAVLDWYFKTSGSTWVVNNLPKNKLGLKVVQKDVLSDVIYEHSLSDRLKRSLIRHDSSKLAQALFDIIDKPKP